MGKKHEVIWQYHKFSDDILQTIFEDTNGQLFEGLSKYNKNKLNTDSDPLEVLDKLLENMIKTICDMVVSKDVNPEEWIVEIGQHLHFEI